MAIPYADFETKMARHVLAHMVKAMLLLLVHNRICAHAISSYN